MRPAGNLIALILAAAIVYMIYKTQFPAGPGGAVPPKQQIDVVGIRSQLLSLAQAERLYFARNGRYASLDELRRENPVLMPGAGSRGYTFVVDKNGSHFKITATPSDSERGSWPTLTIDETMQITQR